MPRAAFGFVAAALLLVNASGLAHAALQDASSNDSSFLSTYGITIILVLMLIGLVVYKRVRSAREMREFAASRPYERNHRVQVTYREPAPVAPPHDPALSEDRRSRERRSPALEGAQTRERPQPVDSEPAAFGGYRVDQEVVKLVLGKTHRMDVMASRATEDRRAIEVSLVKVLDSSGYDEDSRLRARQALEEYGFVARQSALLLMGRDAWERCSAARVLGQIGSQSSLTFLIEALHDPDSIVRNQAVCSLGELRMPAAIGALLDIARRHPDIPASILSESLSACSVESLSYLDTPSLEPAALGGGGPNGLLPEPGSLGSFKELPSGSEDAALTETLTRLEDPDESVRAQVVRELVAQPVQSSVAALAALAQNDPDPAIRSAAVTALGSIGHESVFAPVLIALADESREVRATAARTLSSLHFDRGDAYVRVMETADADTLRMVAKACITTGIVAQAESRLASEDRQQAYEAFSLFSLLARANETQPILEVIEHHNDIEVRRCAVRVLNVAAQPDLSPKLRQLVAGEGLPENVRTALLEVLYKLDHDQPVFDLAASDNSSVSLHNSL
jgi:HEAT repeat protein